MSLERRNSEGQVMLRDGLIDAYAAGDFLGLSQKEMEEVIDQGTFMQNWEGPEDGRLHLAELWAYAAFWGATQT